MRTFNQDQSETRIALTAKKLLVSSLVVLLTACGAGGEADDSDSGTDLVDNEASNQNPSADDPILQETLVSGNAVKGVISRGIVNLYTVEELAGILVRSEQPLTEPVRTDENGYYEFVLEEDLSGQSVVVEITSDSQTMMKCDSTEGCLDNNGAEVAFGDDFNPGSDFSLRAVAQGVEPGESLNVQLNPLTHMIAVHAESSDEGLTLSSLQESISHIEQLLDLDPGSVMSLTPADLTVIESYESISKAELEMGVLSAAFLSMVNGASWDSVGEVIQHLEEVIAADGVLSAQSVDGEDSISLEQVFLEANEIASDLVQALPDSDHIEMFNAVTQETNDSYNEVAGTQELTVLEITSQPQGVTVEEAQEILLVVGAAGDDLSYQWRKDGEVIEGALSNTLLIESALVSDSGSYDVIVSDSESSIESLVALVIVNAQTSEEDPVVEQPPVEEEEPPVIEIEPVQITSQPASVTVAEGEGAQFAVTATGGGAISYQWYRNGLQLAGATSNTLVLSAVSLSDAGSYSVTVSNSVGSESSVVATLSVSEQAIEPIVIVSQPTGVSLLEGESATLRVVATGGGELAYQWYREGIALAGKTSSALSLSQVTSADSGTYNVTVSNSDEVLVSEGASIQVSTELESISISSQPVGAEVNEGESMTISVVATGGGELAYQWYLEGVALPGEVASVLTLNSVSAANAGTYNVTISNGQEVIVSDGASVQVVSLAEPIEIVTQPGDVTADEGELVELTVIASGEVTGYQWYKDSVAITGETSSAISFQTAQLSDSGTYSVTVSSAEETITSRMAVVLVNELQVVEPVSIVSHPAGVAIDEGQLLELTVVATGDELSYQWYKSGVEIAGETDNVLSIASASVTDAGSYSVQVSNSLGLQMSNLASVQVNDIETFGTVSLEWAIPEEREDGSALELNEIDSYVINYGTDSQNLDQSVVVDSGSSTSVEIADLPEGTYYFVISTVDIDGTQGEMSGVISLSI